MFFCKKIVNKRILPPPPKKLHFHAYIFAKDISIWKDVE